MRGNRTPSRAAKDGVGAGAPATSSAATVISTRSAGGNARMPSFPLSRSSLCGGRRHGQMRGGGYRLRASATVITTAPPRITAAPSQVHASGASPKIAQPKAATTTSRRYWKGAIAEASPWR